MRDFIPVILGVTVFIGFGAAIIESSPEPLTNQKIVEEVKFCESSGMGYTLQTNMGNRITSVTCSPKK